MNTARRDLPVVAFELGGRPAFLNARRSITYNAILDMADMLLIKDHTYLQRYQAATRRLKRKLASLNDQLISGLDFVRSMAAIGAKPLIFELGADASPSAPLLRG